MSAQARRRLVFKIIVNMLKGGVAKTTTLMFLALALTRRGKKVLVIDADEGTQGVTDWATQYFERHPDGDLGFHIVQYSSATHGLLIRFVQQVMTDNPDVDIVLIDIGGEAPHNLRQVLGDADLMIMPCMPTKADFSRVGPTISFVRQHRPDLEVHGFLNRVDRPGVGAALDIREGILASGADGVFEAETTANKEKYADPWGTKPGKVHAYGHLADEVLALIAKHRRNAA